MDDRDRDKFYSSTADEDDDGDYELEPPDADVVAGEERRAKEAIDETRMTIDIDEIYREAERDRSREILDNWFENFRFQFQIKHLLIATAVLAIVLTLYRLDMLGTAVVLLIMISVASLYFYLQWQEKKAQDEANRRRQEMYARRRAHLKKMSGDGDEDDEPPTSEGPPTPAEPLAAAADQKFQETIARERFRFRFSLSELMIAMTTAAVLFGLVQILGGEVAATTLGFVALLGLVIHALGVEPPSIVVLGWWMILSMYVCLSIAVAIWSGLA